MKQIILSILLLVFGANVALGQEACRVQRALADKGFYQGEIDCALGPNTRHSIERFQAENGLFVDGVVGEDTYKALFGRFRRQDNPPTADDYRPEPERPTEGRQRCADEIVTASADGLYTSRAKARTIKAWESAVLRNRELGLVMSKWKAATDKVGPTCIRHGGSVNCEARARPCELQAE